MRTIHPVLPIAHGVAGAVALLTISVFLTSTAVSEFVGDPALVARVKGNIAWALLLLVPALITVGGTGRLLAGGSPRGLAGKKYRRMRIVAALGLLVLVPAALLLARWAAEGRYGPAFYAVQGAELLAGAINLVLLGCSFGDGLRLRKARQLAEQRHRPEETGATATVIV